MQSPAAYVDSLRPAGSKRSTKRDLIVNVFLRQEGHLTADDLVDLIRTEDQRISRATVYRTLAWMEQAGIARKVDFGEGRARFEHSYRHPRHFHLICKSCNKSMEFLSSDIEQMIDDVAETRRFALRQAVVQLYGTCDECSTGRKSPTRKVTTELLFARDALRIAVATERSGREFYTRAALMTRDARARRVFQRLSGEEDDHLARLEARYRELVQQDPELESHPPFLFFKGAANGLFSAGVEELSRVSSDRDALMIGIKCERGSHRFFKRYGEKFEDSEGKRVFLEFADEEREHLELLIREYRILTRKGRKTGATTGPPHLMPDATPVVCIENLVKNYRGLRPFRMRALSISPGDRVVMSGFDVITAELFTNLINGATLPDEGRIEVFGAPTAAVTSEEDWLASLDRFGVVTARAVLLDGMSVRQNLALPLSIEIDPMSDDLARRAAVLGAEAGIDATWFERPVHAAGPGERMRLQLARALALDPPLLLLEHPTASLPPEMRAPFARQVGEVARTRQLTVIACSQDTSFAREVATRYLQLQPATGELVEIET